MGVGVGGWREVILLDVSKSLRLGSLLNPTVAFCSSSVLSMIFQLNIKNIDHSHSQVIQQKTRVVTAKADGLLQTGFYFAEGGNRGSTVYVIR